MLFFGVVDTFVEDFNDYFVDIDVLILGFFNILLGTGELSFFFVVLTLFVETLLVPSLLDVRLVFSYDLLRVDRAYDFIRPKLDFGVKFYLL